MTVSNGNSPATVPAGTRPRVHRGAFAVAAVMSPICLAAIGVIGLHAGLLIMGIVAVVSLPAYVGLGLPAAWLAIRAGGDVDGKLSYGVITSYALIADLLIMPIGVPGLMLVQGADLAGAFNAAGSYALIGMVIAPLEALLFAAWYRRLAPVEAPRTDPGIFA